MIAIDNTIVSENLLEKRFVCDLNACKGQCCVDGDSGAPLEEEELEIMDSILDTVLPHLPESGQQAIKEQGVFVLDEDGDYTTPLVDGKHCAFTYFDNGMAKCGIEKAQLKGEIEWQKPISCALYPVRITKYKEYDAVNYHKWSICKPARVCGTKLDVPVYKFLKAPLIRKYGEDWYKQLELAKSLMDEQSFSPDK